MMMSFILLIVNVELCSPQWLLEQGDQAHSHELALGDEHTHSLEDAGSTDHDCCTIQGCEHPRVEVASVKSAFSVAYVAILPETFEFHAFEADEVRTVYVWASTWSHGPPDQIHGRGPPASDGLLSSPSRLNPFAPLTLNPTV